MNVIMVAAISENGLLTDDANNNVSDWTSPEDKAFFASIRSKHPFFIMGRKTYEAAKIVPTPGTLRVVMTNQPDRYTDSAVDGQLEFTDESPTEILARYQNHPTCLLLGGGEIYRRFLQDNLVDEIYLTVEPVRFESGTPLFTDQTLDEFLNSFGKITVADLNSSGTKLYHIQIERL